MREQYYSVIKSKNLPNVLVDIPELPYSKKLKLLQELLDSYNDYVVKVALNIYKQNYIDLNRVRIFTLKNTIKGICKSVVSVQNLISEG